MTKYIERYLFRVYCCNCGDLFSDRESLVIHIKNKKKGKFSEKHFGGDFVSGNKTGLIKHIKCFSEIRVGLRKATADNYRIKNIKTS